MMKLFFLRSLLSDIDALLLDGSLTGERAERMRKTRAVLHSVLSKASEVPDFEVVSVPASVRRKIEKVSWMLSVSDSHSREDETEVEFAW